MVNTGDVLIGGISEFESNARYGIELQNSGAMRLDHSDVGGNTLGGLYDRSTIGAGRHIITANQFGGNCGNDIDIAGYVSGYGYTSDGSTITGNSFIGPCATLTNNTYDSIHIVDSVNSSIVSNRINGGTTGHAFRYGVYIANSLTTDGGDTVTGNAFGIPLEGQVFGTAACSLLSTTQAIGNTGAACPMIGQFSNFTLDNIASGPNYKLGTNYSGPEIVLDNANFITGTLGWQGDGVTIAQDTASPFTNGKSMKITSSVQNYIAETTRYYKVSPSDSLFLSAYLKSDGVFQIACQLNFYDGGSNYLSATPVIGATTSTSWSQYLGVGTVPANAAFMNPICTRADAGGGSHVAWVTDVDVHRVGFPVLNAAGTQQTNPHLVKGTCTLGSTCSVTLSGSSVYTSNSTYDCWARDTTTPANAVTVTLSSGSAVAFTGTGSDGVSFICVGN